MRRKDFIKKGMVVGAGGLLLSKAVKANSNHSNTNKTGVNNVGFNHLPNKEERKMNQVIHRAASRGFANHGWLKSNHTFSFANYYNPERMNFGVLRVLNDDHVAPGMGFGSHPHQNMEIISIPLEGDLEHKDSMGNTTVIKEGDIQVMSAGTGVQHSEYNKNKDRAVKFLQIWVMPNQVNVEPRYDQISIKEIAKQNEFYQILSPNKTDEGVWIHQNAWFSMGEFDEGKKGDYTLKQNKNGVYVFVLEGSVKINNEKLNKRDGFAIKEVKELQLEAIEKSKVLLMEVPMLNV